LANKQASFAKRQKELATKARQLKKAEKRAQKNSTAPTRPENGEDPDIAGIRPGPQPPRED
jgi:sRNA-binding protein